ncbi:WD40 repeat domain-containing protein [Candidatus Dependentiae bacterium]|nr:WD40 repeat domain-containing protein [Candidatus Dependentiae bacterium]
MKIKLFLANLILVSAINGMQPKPLSSLSTEEVINLLSTNAEYAEEFVTAVNKKYIPQAYLDLTIGKVINLLSSDFNYAKKFVSTIEKKTVPQAYQDLIKEKLYNKLYPTLLKIFQVSISLDHSDSVFSVAFSPDGTLALTVCRDKTARLWNLSDINRPIPVIRIDNVNAAAFTPNGKYIFTAGSTDATGILWDIETILWNISALKPIELGKMDLITSVAFSPDGRYILTATSNENDYTIAKLWNISDLNNITFIPLIGHTGSIRSVTFSPDGRYALTGSWDTTARLWNITNLNWEKPDLNVIPSIPLKRHVERINSVAFSPDGKYALTGSEDYTVKLWDISNINWSMPELNKITYVLLKDQDLLRSYVTSVAFSPNGKFILIGTDIKIAILLDLTNRNYVPLVGHKDWVFSVAFSPNGKLALTGSRDLTARLWSLDVNLGLKELIFIAQAQYFKTTEKSEINKLLSDPQFRPIFKSFSKKNQENIIREFFY